MTPLISVIMPVYNAEKYVGEAVESILNQTFGDFEFLIIDDGSTDRSLEILRRYEKQDSRIRLISRLNTGYVVALNEMLGLAKGELIARMDADDISLPGRFEKQIGLLRAHGDIGVVGGGLLMIDPAGDPVMPFLPPTNHDAIDDAHLRGGGGTIPHPTAMIRTGLLRQINGYRREYWPAEDVDLFLRLGEVCRLANLSEIVLHYRLHMESTSHKHQAKQRSAAVAAVADARQRRGFEAVTRETPDTVGDSFAELRAKWAWWALGGGNVATARKHAAKVAMRRPFSLETWRLVACALRGR